MRKLGSEKDIEKKRKRNVTIIGVIILVVLVLSTLGYAFINATENNAGSSNTDSGNADSNAAGLRKVGDRWQLTVNSVTFSFSNSLEEVQNVTFDSNISKGNFIGVPVYIVSKNKAIYNELEYNLAPVSSRIQAACYGPCSDPLPEKNCTESLIVWQDDSINRVYRQDNCVFIQGDLRSADALLYYLLGLKSK